MSQLFSTELLPASDRIDAWQHNARLVCGDCRIQLPKSSFHGAIEARDVGGLTMTRFRSSSLSFWKRPFEGGNPDHRCCIVITQLAGVRRYMQNGISLSLSPGESTLIDSGRPWSSSCETDCARLYFRVPWWMMQDRLQMREIPIAQRLGAGGGSGERFFRFSQSLYENSKRLQEADAALEAYFRFLSTCLGRMQWDWRPSPNSRLRIQQFVNDHLSDPELGPAKIAAAADISVRHLHRVFSNTSSTVGHYIRAQRLEQCRHDLVNPGLRGKTITEIAYSWGFSDSAHFSRSFHWRFGICPRIFRAQAGVKMQDDGQEQNLHDLLRAGIVEPRHSKPN